MDLCDCFSLYFVQISGQKIRQSYKQGIFICHMLQNTAEYRLVIYKQKMPWKERTTLNLCKFVFLCLNFVPFTFTVISLRSAIYHIFALGKNPDVAKENWKAQSIWKKIFLLGVVEQCQTCSEEAKYLRIIYWLVIAVHAVRFLQWVESFYTTRFDTILLCNALIKILLLDIPIIVCCTKIKQHEVEDSQLKEE